MSEVRRVNRVEGWVATLLLAVGGGSSALGDSPVRPVLFHGEIVANDVYVRSGDSLNHYTICKLKAGDRVDVVGERGEWLEILPPLGTFSLISGDFVDTVDNQSGVVNGDNVRVRAGSLLNSNKYTVQTMLQKGAEVSIMGSNPDGFLRILPPPGATLWVNRAYVERSSGTDDATAGASSGRSAAVGAEGIDSAAPGANDKPVGDRLADGETGGRDTTGESSPSVSAGDAAGDAAAGGRRDGSGSAESGGRPLMAASIIPSTSPLAAIPATHHARQLQALESALEVELTKPLHERQFAELLAGYRTLAEQSGDDVAKRYALGRVGQINDMQDILGTAINLRKLDEDAERQRQEFFAARARIPIAPPPPPPGFDVQGVLRDSALYPAGSLPRRYRVVDPATGGRTIAYIEVPLTVEMDLDDYLGRFVGVRASSKRPQEGAIDPVPIYVVSEVVELTSGESPDGSAGQP
ncbi:MAG: hypothetical protein HY763_10145 [Planctomycetes bacterium]|nr:hypothetical protein [Planctomycetota bacterium]